MLNRYLMACGLMTLAVAFMLSTDVLAAGGKKRNNDVKLSGEIIQVGKDDSSVTINVGQGKAAAHKEIKIDAKTSVEYVGIDNQDEKKLQKGYFVMAVMGENNTATVLSVKKDAFAGKK